MSDPDEPIPEAALQSLKVSGFPFQTRVEHIIRTHQKDWYIHRSEYPWRDDDSGDQFLDLVATKKNLFAAIECKKSQEILTFLLPAHAHTEDTRYFRCLRADPHFLPTRAGLFCEDWELRPSSARAEFCVVSTSKSGKDQRLLERDASLLIRATNALAHDLGGRFGDGRHSSPPSIFVPVMVTNATMYAARYKEEQVSLDSGEIGEAPAEVHRVPWIRFHKAFTAGDGWRGERRTIFIVGAMHLVKFLALLEPNASQPGFRDKVLVRGQKLIV